MSAPDDWIYTEKTGYKNHLHIIGAGHCALALTKLMRLTVDFYIHVYDDRSELKTFTENEYGHDKKLLTTYEGISNSIPPGDHQYIVVMTVGYRTDDIVIRSLLKNKYKYVGLLGSTSKVAQLFATYATEGMPAEVIQTIHAPAGIAIKSQTPEEIAVSIAAEIIREKNKE